MEKEKWLEVVAIIKKLENTSSTNDKIMILNRNKDNELLQKVLIYTYDKHLKFKVSKKTIKPREGISKWNDFFDMCDELSISNINDKLKLNVNRFLGSIEDEGMRDLLIKILLKDLKCKISTKIINKAMGNLIFDFQVMKASAWNEKTKRGFELKAKKHGYMMTIKENGERGIVIKENGVVTIKSRQDKLFLGLSDLEKAFENMADNFVYEGELLAFNPKGEDWETSEEQFKLTNSILHTDGDNKKGIYISLFDMIPLEDFKNGRSEIKAIDRRNMLKEEIEKNNNELVKYVKVLYVGKDADMIQRRLEEVSKDSYKEGLMVLINNSIYEAKRVTYHLKVKLWQTMDLEVIGLNESIEKPNSLGSLKLDFKGQDQGCSGISDSLKELWWNNPSEIIGKIVEVKYKAITLDKEGNESLQFCTFVKVRDDKTRDDISYE